MIFLTGTLSIFFWGIIAQAEVSQNLQLEFWQTQYLTESTQPSQLDKYSDARVDFNYFARDTQSEVAANAAGIYSLNGTRDNHFIVPQLYYTQRAGRWSLTLGRVLLPWSSTEDHWGMGLWQPQFRWDALHPEPQGLSGITIQRKGAKFQWLALFSPVYFPDQGPQYGLNDGAVESSNRWFESPIDQVVFADRPSRVDYTIQRPSTSDVIQNPGFALLTRWGKDSGPWLQAAWAYKPKNQFHFDFESHESLALNKDFPKEVTVYPSVIYHRLTTLETGWREDDFTLLANLTHEQPLNPDTEVGREAVRLYNGQILAFRYQQSLRPMNLPRHSVQLDMVNVWQQTAIQDAEGGILDRTRDDVRSSHFRFGRAVSMGWQMRISRSVRYRLSTGALYTYDLADESGWLTAQAMLGFDQRWNFQFSADVMGVSEDESAQGILSRYKSNDRIRGGFVYVF